MVLTVSVGYTAYRVHAQSAQLHAFHTHWGRAYEDLDARLQVGLVSRDRRWLVEWLTHGLRWW